MAPEFDARLFRSPSRRGHVARFSPAYQFLPAAGFDAMPRTLAHGDDKRDSRLTISRHGRWDAATMISRVL